MKIDYGATRLIRVSANLLLIAYALYFFQLEWTVVFSNLTKIDSRPLTIALLVILILTCDGYSIKFCVEREIVERLRKFISLRESRLNPNQIVLKYFLIFIVAGFIEEFLFRGYVLLPYEKLSGLAVHFVILSQGLLWGAVHLGNGFYKDGILKSDLQYRLVVNPIQGIAYGLVTLATGTILISYILHMLHNLMILGIVLHSSPKLAAHI